MVEVRFIVEYSYHTRVYNMSYRYVHATDSSMMSRVMLFSDELVMQSVPGQAPINLEWNITAAAAVQHITGGHS